MKGEERIKEKGDTERGGSRNEERNTEQSRTKFVIKLKSSI